MSRKNRKRCCLFQNGACCVRISDGIELSAKMFALMRNINHNGGEIRIRRNSRHRMICKKHALMFKELEAMLTASTSPASSTSSELLPPPPRPQSQSEIIESAQNRTYAEFLQFVESLDNSPIYLAQNPKPIVKQKQPIVVEVPRGSLKRKQSKPNKWPSNKPQPKLADKPGIYVLTLESDHESDDDDDAAAAASADESCDAVTTIASSVADSIFSDVSSDELPDEDFSV